MTDSDKNPARSFRCSPRDFLCIPSADIAGVSSILRQSYQTVQSFSQKRKKAVSLVSLSGMYAFRGTPTVLIYPGQFLFNSFISCAANQNPFV